MKHRINISLDIEIAEKLKRLAEESHRNVSQWITDKVIEADKSEEKQEKPEKKGK
ncbi:MAG: ribbon-helix-helix protein, CopG family [Ruminococcus sp.]|nr:ribbon-helix-helix protein, CopG family [Ruminococcus sp.]